MLEEGVQFYKMRQLAKLLNVSVAFINRKAIKNKINSVWFGGNRMFHIDEVNRIIKEGIE